MELETPKWYKIENGVWGSLERKTGFQYISIRLKILLTKNTKTFSKGDDWRPTGWVERLEPGESTTNGESTKPKEKVKNVLKKKAFGTKKKKTEL